MKMKEDVSKPDLSTSLLISHVRHEDRTPFATISVDKNGNWGMSICNKKDRFNKKRGVSIAVGRMLMGSEITWPNRKDSALIVESLRKMEERASKYFKNNHYSINKTNIPVSLKIETKMLLG